MNRKNYIYILSCTFLCVFFSCKHSEGEYHSLNEKLEVEGEHYKGVSVSSEAYFNDIKTLEITEDPHTFLIPERKSQIKSFECIECHTEPLNKLKNKDIKKAHWDISLNHANGETMNCATCHKGNDMNNLKTLTGKHVDFNLSHKLCSQCHSTQFEDWKGGAHGKRIGGWAPPRASFTCVNCHNPHNPGFESRWPARFNTNNIEEKASGFEH